MQQLIQRYREKTQGRAILEEWDRVVEATIGKPAVGTADLSKIDNLLPIHRLEAFSVVLQGPPSNDLRQVFWLTAVNAEAWARQIAHYSKTTAVMSIVGYVIGLGDRHPSNIMISRLSGSVAHIDFGDCFEVNQQRKTLAETIPFRLTRMMVEAFGSCGIDGSFRVTCEQTVGTIRGHREAIIPVLEIFVREPVSSGGFVVKGGVSPISGSVQIEDTRAEDTDPSSQAAKRMAMFVRMIQKIDGKDFENHTPLSAEEQVERLIRAATDPYNLSHLYHGWGPLW
jgi:FKBP12-rapamycin complex-associated protein